MKRRKRIKIRLVALGFAITAIAAPVAQAVPLDSDTNSVESGLYYSAVDNSVTSPDDRKMHATWSQQSSAVDTVIAGPDDRKAHATWPTQPTPGIQPTQVVANDDDGFGTDSVVGGFMLLLVGSIGIAVIARTVRNGRLAPT
jgi:hypothetical protein